MRTSSSGAPSAVVQRDEAGAIAGLRQPQADAGAVRERVGAGEQHVIEVRTRTPKPL